MMLYFDTSFIVPLFLPEATSERVQQFFQRVQADELAISHWSRVEFASTLAREVRTGRLSRQAASVVETMFEEVVDESFVVLSPEAEDYILACNYLRQYETGLRGGDALHLAIAANRRADTIFSLDRGFTNAAKHLDLPVRSGIRLP